VQMEKEGIKSDENKLAIRKKRLGGGKGGGGGQGRKAASRKGSPLSRKGGEIEGKKKTQVGVKYV